MKTCGVQPNPLVDVAVLLCGRGPSTLAGIVPCKALVYGVTFALTGLAWAARPLASVLEGDNPPAVLWWALAHGLQWPHRGWKNAGLACARFWSVNKIRVPVRVVDHTSGGRALFSDSTQ